jgi:hypothetical protein
MLESLPGVVTRPTYPWRKRGLVSYGAPFFKLAAAHVERLHKQRVFVVVSGSLARSTEHYNDLRASLGSKLVREHIGFRPHVPWGDVFVLAKEV